MFTHTSSQANRGATSVETRCPSCGKRNRVPVASRGRPRCAQCATDLPWLVEAGDDTFDGAVDTGQLVLVDLWAPWCGPCRMVAPVVEQIAEAYAGRVKVVKVNVDAAPGVGARFNAVSIPTLLLIRDGALVDRVVGALGEPALRSKVDAALASS